MAGLQQMSEQLTQYYNYGSYLFWSTAYNLRDLPTTIYDYLFGDFGSENLRNALHEPIKGWLPNIALQGTQPFKVINPDIPLAAYKINVEADANGHLNITGSTPRLKFHSIPTDPESAEYKRDLSALKSWYGDIRVMFKYAFGGTKTEQETEGRFKQLSDRFKAGNPYGAVIATFNGTPVGMYTLGHGEAAGEAEFAVVEDPRFWNKGFFTEMALSLAFVKRDLQIEGNPLYIKNKVNGVEIAQPLTTVAGTSRRDNYAHKGLRGLFFTPREENTRRYGDGLQTRDMFRENVEELDQIRQSSELARITEGTYSSLPPVPKTAPRLTGV